MKSKTDLRKQLRKLRREHVAAQPAAIRALLFNRPPAPLLDLIANDAVIALYHANSDEAPTASYSKFFYERGHRIALPRFASRTSAMEFAEHTDPFGQSDLIAAPFGERQPDDEAVTVEPDVLFIPLLAFTAHGARLGQGGGHYDRWLAAHTGKTKVGLAWDMQRVDDLPQEPHDHKLDAIVTPTRMYGPL